MLSDVIVMLSVIMLNGVMLNVNMLSAILLSVVENPVAQIKLLSKWY